MVYPTPRTPVKRKACATRPWSIAFPSVCVAGASDALRTELVTERGARTVGATLIFDLEGDAALQEMLAKILADKARVESVIPKRGTLEELFVRRAL